MRHRPSPTRLPIRLLAVALAATVVGVTGCTAAKPSTPPVDANAPVTLKLGAFGDTSIVKKQAEQYHALHPNVTVEVTTVASAEDARTALLTKLAAGTGLADVEQLEISWVGQLQKYSSKFQTLPPDQFGPFLPVQAQPVATKDGQSFAYGLGTGPQAICYHADMFKKAGLPSDPAAVATLLGSSWDDFFAAGRTYADAGGPGKWYDSSYLVYNAQIEQMEFPYETTDGTIVANNPAVEKAFKDTLAAGTQLSANLSAFSEDWNNGMGTSKYATLTCPSWLLSTIQGNSKGVDDWRIADAFPGGGGSVGGSFLAVPTQSKNATQAEALASWLTAPDQQIATFEGGGAFPSRTQALDSPALAAIANPYFGDAKVGTIFSNRSKAIAKVMYKGPHYISIDTAAFNAITRVEAGQQSVDAAWQQFVSEAQEAK